MKAIILDDEPLVAEYLQMICAQVSDLDVIHIIYSPQELLEVVCNEAVDLIFMDIEMPGMNGIQTVHELHKLAPEIAIIFVTGYEQYAFEAFGLDAVSYLLKPCTVEEVEKAVEKASRLLPVMQSRVRIQTFGKFAIFLDNQPYHITNKKALELLAILVDRRGEIVSMEQAIDILWEDRPYDDTVKQLYRRSVITLNQLMKEKKLDFFISNRGSCHIVPSKIICDYYDFLEGKGEAIRYYTGEYMAQYSWAEESIGKIENFL